MATGKPPFVGHDQAVITQILNIKKQVPELKGDWSDEFIDFVRFCLQKDKD